MLITFGKYPGNPALLGSEINEELQDSFEMLEQLKIIESYGVLRTQEEFVGMVQVKDFY